LSVVVSDAGPLIHLAQIGKLQLLEKLFGMVIVNARVKLEVYDEGVQLGCPDAELIGKALEEGWLLVETVPERFAKSAVKLVVGENISMADAETLLMANEKKAELLTDEKVLSNLAKMYGVKCWSTWTLLLEGLSRNIVEVADVESAISDLGKKKFRLNLNQSREILDAAKFIEKGKRRAQFLGQG
jgi:predicted nucleic acid-binding protein